MCEIPQRLPSKIGHRDGLGAAISPVFLLVDLDEQVRFHLLDEASADPIPPESIQPERQYQIGDRTTVTARRYRERGRQADLVSARGQRSGDHVAAPA